MTTSLSQQGLIQASRLITHILEISLCCTPTLECLHRATFSMCSNTWRLSAHTLGVITSAFVLIRKLFLKAFQLSDVDAQIHPLPASELHI